MINKQILILAIVLMSAVLLDSLTDAPLSSTGRAFYISSELVEDCGCPWIQPGTPLLYYQDRCVRIGSFCYDGGCAIIVPIGFDPNHKGYSTPQNPQWTPVEDVDIQAFLSFPTGHKWVAECET